MFILGMRIVNYYNRYRIPEKNITSDIRSNIREQLFKSDIFPGQFLKKNLVKRL